MGAEWAGASGFEDLRGGRDPCKLVGGMGRVRKKTQLPFSARVRYRTAPFATTDRTCRARTYLTVAQQTERAGEGLPWARQPTTGHKIGHPPQTLYEGMQGNRGSG